MPLQSKDKPQIFRLRPVVQESVITDFLEPFREHMHQKAADEFRVLQCDRPQGFSRPPAPCRKSGVCFRDRQDPAVGDGDLMGIAAEVLNGVPKAIEGFFYVRAPVLIVKRIPEFSPMVRVPQLFAGSGKNQLSVLEEGLEPREELPFKLIPEGLHTDKEVFLDRPDLMAGGEAAAGNDAVHMYMVAQLLVPGVEYLYDTWNSPEMLFVSGKFQKCYRAAPVEKAVEQPLVRIKERVEFMWEREDQMEIGGINHFGPAFIDPEFFLDSLAAGAAAVAAGAVVDFDMAALCTLADTVTYACRC